MKRSGLYSRPPAKPPVQPASALARPSPALAQAWRWLRQDARLLFFLGGLVLALGLMLAVGEARAQTIDSVAGSIPLAETPEEE